MCTGKTLWSVGSGLEVCEASGGRCSSLMTLSAGGRYLSCSVDAVRGGDGGS